MLINVGRRKRTDSHFYSAPPSDDGENTMEAWSNPSGMYSQITFCSRFFNDLRPLKEVVDSGKKKSAAIQDNLETWNSRARCFFHEVTHLTYFMNTPGEGPNVEDLQIKFKPRGQKGQTVTDIAYGPYNTKLLRNYVWRGKGNGGFYTQRNGKRQKHEKCVEQWHLTEYKQRIPTRSLL